MDTSNLYSASLLSCRLLAGLALISGLTLLAFKSMRELFARYASRRETYFLGPIVQHLMAEDATPPVLKRRRLLDGAILERLLLAMSANVSGRDLERLQYLFQTEGFAFEEAINLHTSRRWWLRAKAAQRLGQMRAASGKYALVEALHDKEIEVRLMAAWALGQTGDLETLRPIFGSLAGFSKIAALRVANIVVGFGAAATPVLLQLLATSEPEVQGLTLRMLAEVGDPGASRPVSVFLRSPDKELRIGACEALARIGDAGASLPLRGALADPEWPVVAKAAQALGRLGDAGAIPQLTAQLSHREWWVRLHAGEALSRLGDAGRRALEDVRDVSPDRFARDMAAQWLDELEHALVLRPDNVA